MISDVFQRLEILQMIHKATHAPKIINWMIKITEIGNFNLKKQRSANPVRYGKAASSSADAIFMYLINQ